MNVRMSTTALSLAAALVASPAAAQHDHGRPSAPAPGPHSDAPPPPRPYEAPKADRTIEIVVGERGFEPETVTVKKGERIRLVVTRRTNDTCAREFILDEYLVWNRLAINEAAVSTFTTGRVGEFPYRCLKGTFSGVFKVVE